MLQKAAAAKVLKLDKARGDSTVCGGQRHVPDRLRPAGQGGPPYRLPHHGNPRRRRGPPGPECGTDAGQQAGKPESTAAHLKRRNDDARVAVKAITGDLADLAELAASEAAAVVTNARRKLARDAMDPSCKLGALVADFETILGHSAGVVAQTRSPHVGGPSPAEAAPVIEALDLARDVRHGHRAPPVGPSTVGPQRLQRERTGGRSTPSTTTPDLENHDVDPSENRIASQPRSGPAADDFAYLACEWFCLRCETLVEGPSVHDSTMTVNRPGFPGDSGDLICCILLRSSHVPAGMAEALLSSLTADAEGRAELAPGVAPLAGSNHDLSELHLCGVQAIRGCLDGH